jgi:hypothetical protein
MYVTTLVLHSWLRWAVIIVGLWAVARAFAGLSSRRSWAPTDDSVGRWFTVALDVQFLVGIVLYGLLSPVTRQAFSDMGVAMRDPMLRFWAVEHVSLGILALVLAHVGRARAGRAVTDVARHRTSAVFYTLALVAILLATPWPFRAAGRELLRF